MNLPLHMRAVHVARTGGPDVLTCGELRRPEPIGRELLVKVAAAGVNYIDVYYRTGLYETRLPVTLGFEGAGTVVATGDDVLEFRAGERVTWALALGSYAEYAIVPESAAVAVPSGIDDNTAAASMVQGTTAHYLTHDTYPIANGDTVLIHAAAGGTGLLLTQMAKHRGAHVIATVSTAEKAEIARGAGADDVILYTERDFEAEVRRITDGAGVACVYDSVGKTTFDKSLNCLRPLGTMVLCGTSSGPVGPFRIQDLSEKGSLYLTRPNGFTHTAKREDFLRHANAVLNGILDGTITIRAERLYPLEAAATAHRDLESRKTTGKLLLIPQQ